MALDEGASLRHGYLQLEEAAGAAHTKSTFVQQAERSSYTLTEACLGAQLARHDVDVQQVRRWPAVERSSCIPTATYDDMRGPRLACAQDMPCARSCCSANISSRSTSCGACAQTGEETRTNMRHFVLSGRGQTHDVHTKLRLQHPRGEATQLHKCIVSAPSGEVHRDSLKSNDPFIDSNAVPSLLPSVHMPATFPETSCDGNRSRGL